MHHVKEIKHIAHFVALQGANEMPFHPVSPELANLVTGFLQIVFTKNGHSGRDGGPDACSVHSLTRRHQPHARRVTAYAQGCLSDALLHTRHILCDREDFV
jgi:hypothetical protein